ncbi:MAG: protein-methionine-sulfoxide reductase catalytic subunit MsrP [Beijerinckiaceae bacterium]
MHIIHRKGWEMSESEATPEHVFLNRRQWLAGGASLGAAGLITPASAQWVDPSAGLYPAKRNEVFKLDRDVTTEEVNTNYNNFYEFGSTKRVGQAAKALKTRPWTVKIDGLVEKPLELDIDDMLKRVTLEERLLRHRCVEAWAMAVPWTGFPLKALLDIAKPQGSAKFVRFETFLDAKIAPGQKQTWYPWPYTEGLTIAEAANDLSFMVTGAYGKPLANVFGAPLRLALPWKYGFKHIKSITRITLVEQRPKSFWEALQPAEYGFWANVNPEVPHPRWSQATEEIIGTGKRVPTQLYNGYGAFVADLYKGMEKERLWT